MSEIFRILSREVPSRIVEFFLEHPTSGYTQSSLMRNLKISKVSVSKWLKRLVRNGILGRYVDERRVEYRLNEKNPIVRQLKVLRIVSMLYPLFKDLNVDVFIFGSSALGEDDEKSDVDLLIMGKQNDELIKKIASCEKKIKKKIHLVFYTPVEWSRVAREDPAFYEMVEKTKIKLV